MCQIGGHKVVALMILGEREGESEGGSLSVCVCVWLRVYVCTYFDKINSLMFFFFLVTLNVCKCQFFLYH
jgi:hypothetical protein